MTGVLVAFEGLDQSGKETQARRLAARCQAAGHATDFLAFPCYQTPIAGEIAATLRGERTYAPDVLQLLFMTNRYEHRERIRQGLDAGKIVICDRYTASSLAYGAACGVDPSWMADVQRGLPRAAVTVLLDVGPERAAARKAHDRDAFERDLALLTRVRAEYLRLAQQDPSWIIIDAAQSIDAVATAVNAAVDARIARPPAR